MRNYTFQTLMEMTSAGKSVGNPNTLTRKRLDRLVKAGHINLVKYDRVGPDRVFVYWYELAS